MNIKVVSLNIEYCSCVNRGYWQYLANLWKYVLPHDTSSIWHISDVINHMDVDIATFTEMDGGGYRTNNVNYMDVISNLTPLKNNIFYPVNSMMLNFGVRGNGISTRFKIIDAKNIKLEKSFIGENRYLSASHLDIGGKKVNILTTQLALGSFSRTRELEHIARLIQSMSGPIIFSGDLNTEDEKQLQVIESAGLKRVETSKTFPSWKPSRRIDYIFYSKEFEVVTSKVLDDLKASDHLPIYAELKLKNNSKKK